MPNRTAKWAGSIRKVQGGAFARLRGLEPMGQPGMIRRTRRYFFFSGIVFAATIASIGVESCGLFPSLDPYGPGLGDDGGLSAVDAPADAVNDPAADVIEDERRDVAMDTSEEDQDAESDSD